MNETLALGFLKDEGRHLHGQLIKNFCNKSNRENLAQNVIFLRLILFKRTKTASGMHFLRIYLVVTSKKKSIFKDIIQIKVDHPPSYPIFDKLFFDKF